MTIARRTALTGLLTATALPRPAGAQERFPSRLLELAVGFAPGGTTDIYARLMAEHLRRTLGQAVVVTNRVGAATNLASAHVAAAAADGHVLCVCVTNVATNAFLYAALPYRPEDLIPVGLMFNSPFGLVVAPNAPYRTVAALVEAARARPGALNYATTGAGGATHLMTERFLAATGVRATAVHYRGAAPAVTAALTGEVQFSMPGITTALPYLPTGTARVLGVTTAARLPAAPEVPTLVEQGYPDLVGHVWYGVLAPAGTPRPVIEALNREIAAFVALPETQERLRADGSVSVPGLSPEAFGRQIREETEAWRQVIAPLNLRLD